MSSEVSVNLKNIRNVEIKSKVVDVKDDPPKVVTVVRFEYDGEPSQMETILLLETQGKPVNASFDTPQLAFTLEDS